MTEERVLYRVRKTVFEMLRDRGYQISDAQIEESFEDFEKSYLEQKQINFIAHRPIEDASADAENERMEEGKDEVIYVVFQQNDEKLGQDSIKKLVTWMNTYSSSDSKSSKTEPLMNCIIVGKSGVTSLAKKVSEFCFKHLLGV